MTTQHTSSTNKTPYHHGDLQQSLLRAAEQELIEKGVESFSLRSVAKRAGVSHGAPAHHFQDVNGLLTQLAAVGYKRFIDVQVHRQQQTESDPLSQLAASGLGYIDFAVNNPALFRLMFSSQRTNRDDRELFIGADAAFNKLVEDVSNIINSDPFKDREAMVDVMAAWVVAHGLADLMITGRFDRMTFFSQLDVNGKEQVFSDIILRSIKVDLKKEVK